MCRHLAYLYIEILSEKESIMKTYSIIIPHKNTPHLLIRCMDSIPQREDVEIIVVDDNSDFDNWDPAVFTFLNRSDTRMIFTKEGKGAGYARNVGLHCATGKWLLFADADDYYTDGFLDALDKYKDSDPDVVYFCVGEDSEVAKRINQVIKNYLNNPVLEKDNLTLRYWAPWNKMFRRDYIVYHNFLFEEVYVGNDAMFVIKSGYYANRIEVDLFTLYNYTINSKSLTRFECIERDLSRFELYLKINKFYKSIGKKTYISLFGFFVEEWKCGRQKLYLNYFLMILKHRQFCSFVSSFLIYIIRKIIYVYE